VHRLPDADAAGVQVRVDGEPVVTERLDDEVPSSASKVVNGGSVGGVLIPILTTWDIRGTQRSRRSSPRASPQVTATTNLGRGGL
jgi:hypothetical protein